MADALESVFSDNTRRVYGTQRRIFTGWCDQVGLASLPAEPLTVARYLATRAGSGASIATLRLASSAITKAHEWAGHESPGKDRGVRASLRGWGRRLAKPQRKAAALDTIGPQKPAKTSRDGRTSMGQNHTPNQTPFVLVSQVPGQATTRATPRKRKPRPPRSKAEQLSLPGLLPNGEESTA